MHVMAGIPRIATRTPDIRAGRLRSPVPLKYSDMDARRTCRKFEELRVTFTGDDRMTIRQNCPRYRHS